MQIQIQIQMEFLQLTSIQCIQIMEIGKIIHTDFNAIW